MNSDTPGTAFRKLIEGLGRGVGGVGELLGLKTPPIKTPPLFCVLWSTLNLIVHTQFRFGKRHWHPLFSLLISIVHIPRGIPLDFTPGIFATNAWLLFQVVHQSILEPPLVLFIVLISLGITQTAYRVFGTSQHHLGRRSSWISHSLTCLHQENVSIMWKCEIVYTSTEKRSAVLISFPLSPCMDPWLWHSTLVIACQAQDFLAFYQIESTVPTPTAASTYAVSVHPSSVTPSSYAPHGTCKPEFKNGKLFLLLYIFLKLKVIFATREEVQEKIR